MKNNKQYGLFTAITMIIGICIGSGIFFKSDNILVATNGSIFLGVCLFALAAFSIIFGSLTIGQLASRSENPGGMITYAQDFIGDQAACSFGWFQTFIYYPTITVVVAWVIGVYTGILFHLNASLELEIMIGLVFLTLCFIYNVVSPMIGKTIQNGATIVKMIPLFLLGILGMLFGDPIGGLTHISTNELFSVTWLSALGPIAYSYDGWIVSTSIAHEVKDSKKTLPRALTIAPLIILIIYVTYFVGISSYLGPQNVMALGDQHVSVAASQLVGVQFSKMIVIFVIISVMGTVNGLVTGFIRTPYSLALRETMMPFSKKLSAGISHHGVPIYSAVFAYVLAVFWMFIHYICAKYHLLPNSDVSEISIAISYLLYIMLYYQVYRLYKAKEITSKFKGIICPLLATVGSLIILSGGIQSSLFIYYLIFCLTIMLLGRYYYKKNSKVV